MLGLNRIAATNHKLMRQSKLAIITSVLGLTVTKAAELGILGNYQYQSVKSEQTVDQQLAAIAKAKAKAARRNRPHVVGMFAKV